jgi:pyridoxamine 5'-phosphate oxidase-like protein
MTAPQPTETTNLDIYGNATLEWDRVLTALASPPPQLTHFLSTVGHDGKPHIAGVGAIWDEGAYYMTSGPAARKARNLAANPACALAVQLVGLDLVFEGEMARVTDPDVLERVAARYRESGWPVTVEGDAFVAPFSAPSAGPPPWHLYRLTFHTVFGVATAEPYGAVRWRF